MNKKLLFIIILIFGIIACSEKFNYGGLNDDKKIIKAIENNDIKTVKSILKEGKIDINKIHEFSNIFELNGTTNTEKYTALIKSVQKTNYEISKLLIENNANVNIKYEIKSLPSEQYLKLTALEIAAESNDYEIVKLLVDNGANVDENSYFTRDSFEEYKIFTLMTACVNGNLEMVKLFIENGADINSKGLLGDETALIVAANSGKKDIVKYLIENGADVNTKCSVYKYTDGYTALMFASIRGYYEIVEILLDNKADINATTDLGRTALMELLLGFMNGLPESGLYETVKILIDRGADIKIKDEDGKTALDYAKEKELKDIEELLINSLSK